ERGDGRARVAPRGAPAGPRARRAGGALELPFAGRSTGEAGVPTEGMGPPLEEAALALGGGTRAKPAGADREAPPPASGRRRGPRSEDGGGRRGGRRVKIEGSRAFIATWTLAVLAAVCAFVLHLALRSKSVALGYEIGRVRAEQARLREVKRVLQLEA